MRAGHTLGVTPFNRWIPSVALLCATTTLLGYAVARDSRIAILLLVGVVVVALIIAGNVRLLIPMTTASLVLGSTSIPNTSVWFVAKFTMVGAVVATILPALASRREHLPVPVRFVIGFGGLIALMLLSTAWSVAPVVTVTKAISMLLLWLAVAVAIPLGFRDHQDLVRTVFWIGVVAAMTVLAGLALSAVGVVPWLDAAGRFRGILVNANTLGYFVAPILPALIILASRLQRGDKRLVLIGAISVVAAGLALSGSRAGALASTAGLLAALAASRATGEKRQKRRTLIIVIFGAAAAIVVFSSLHIRTADAGGEGFFQLGTGSLRRIVWTDGLRLISERPLVGHGFATTEVLIPSVQDTSQGTILGSVHNSYLEAAIDLGWIGALLLTFLGASGLVAAWRVSRSADQDSWVGAMLVGPIVGGMVNGVFESGLLAAGGLIAFHFWLMVAMAHSLRLQQMSVRTLEVAADPAPAQTYKAPIASS